MIYKRTQVTTREIKRYVTLKIDRLKEAEFIEKDERKRLILLKRRAELDKLLGVINNDTIKNEIKKMKYNKYTKYKYNNNRGLKEGCSVNHSALTDVSAEADIGA